MEKGSIIIDESWKIVTEKYIPQKIIDGLSKRAQELHNIDFAGTGTGKIKLKIKKMPSQVLLKKKI